jgi:hypothetical protein
MKELKKKAHKATQTIKDTLHTMNTTHKRVKLYLVTGCGGL